MNVFRRRFASGREHPRIARITGVSREQLRPRRCWSGADSAAVAGLGSGPWAGLAYGLTGEYRSSLTMRLDLGNPACGRLMRLGYPTYILVPGTSVRVHTASLSDQGRSS